MNNKLTQPIYQFHRVRLGHKTTSKSGSRYGPYLYRNLENGELVASWDEPKHGTSYLYKGADIGCNTDALTYYKNE